MARGVADKAGAAPQVDGAGVDGTTAQATPAADTPVEASLDTQAAARGPVAAKARLAQLAALTPDGGDPIVRGGTPVYPGPMDDALPEPDTTTVVDGGGPELGQVLFNFYRWWDPNGVVRDARRGDVVAFTKTELDRGVSIGGLLPIKDESG